MDGKGNPSESPLFSNSFDALLKRRMAEHSYESSCEKKKALAGANNAKRKAYFLAAWNKRFTEHREEVQQYKREYYQAHRAEMIERARQWRKDNPEKVKIQMQRFAEKRRAKRKAMLELQQKTIQKGENI